MRGQSSDGLPSQRQNQFQQSAKKVSTMVEWSAEFETGHPEIDEQHRQLFELTNRLSEAQSVDELKVHLMLLYRHTRIHFADEELQMNRAGYPGAAAHAGYHNQLLDRLNRLAQKVGSGDFDRAAVERLMSDWALRHIRFDDLDAADYLSAD